MRAPRRTAAVLGAALAGTMLAGPALADSAPPVPVAGSGPIGGPQLASGLAVNLTRVIKPLPTGTQAKSWLVADLDTGNVLAAYNAHATHSPASTLKTLAAVTFMPKIPLTAKVTFTQEELDHTAQKDGKTTLVGLVPGSTYSAQQLYDAMLSLSANDAAEALAGAYPGGRAAALAQMNAVAQALQAKDTFAGSPDGLEAPGQQTSAYDEALIARAALASPEFIAANTVPLVKVTAKGQKTVGGSNHDRLINSYTGAIGGKDGYTTKSGQVWWGAAQKNGHRLVVVVMDAGYAPVTQEINLLNWGFAVVDHIRPVGTLVQPVEADGTKVTVAQAAASPQTVTSAAAPKAAAKKSNPNQGESGPWRWILGLLVIAVAAMLGRRHLRAAPSAEATPKPARPARQPRPRPTGTVSEPAPIPAAEPSVPGSRGSVVVRRNPVAEPETPLPVSRAAVRHDADTDTDWPDPLRLGGEPWGAREPVVAPGAEFVDAWAADPAEDFTQADLTQPGLTVPDGVRESTTPGRVVHLRGTGTQPLRVNEEAEPPAPAHTRVDILDAANTEVADRPRRQRPPTNRPAKRRRDEPPAVPSNVDRLRTGAVRIVPAPSRSGDDLTPQP